MISPQSIPSIIQVGDPVLRLPARELRREEIALPGCRQLIEQMREVLRAAPGVGLAAPQLGHSLRLAVVEDRSEYHKSWSAEELAARRRVPIAFQVLINPRILARSTDSVCFHEGCLSLTGYLAEVSRAEAVSVVCLDERGEERRIEAEGWYARILQHEIDHLDGTLYVDRMDTRSFTSRENYETHGRRTGT